MAKRTPPYMAKGRYTLLAPWTTNPAMLYTCMAIRSFEDIYKLGVDVYTNYYVPRGVTNGANIGGTPFSFDAESALKPNIITLVGDDNSVIYVPDTFILSYPNQGEVRYSRMVLSIDLGARPDYLDLSALKTSVGDLVAQQFGVVPTVTEHRAPSFDNPTASQHDVLETARIGAITVLETDHSAVLRLTAEKALVQAKLDALIAILQDLGQLPT